MLLLSIFLSFYRFSFGPQHPASHGVLTCLLYLSNEYIVMCDPIIGYLHRGTEKLCEYKTPNQAIPYFDRLDYVSVAYNEASCVYTYELILSLNISLYDSFFRTILLELTRIFNNLLALSCMIFDVGCMSPLLWCFEERCKLMTIFEFISGARMHIAYFSIGGILDSISFEIKTCVYELPLLLPFYLIFYHILHSIVKFSSFA